MARIAVGGAAAASSRSAAARPAARTLPAHSSTGTSAQAIPAASSAARVAGQARARDGVGGVAAAREAGGPACARRGSRPNATTAKRVCPSAVRWRAASRRGRLVGDADRGQPGARGLVDDDRGQRARHGEREQRVVLGDGVDDDAVDHRARQRRGPAVRDEEQAEPLRLGGRADAGDDRRRRGIVEGVGEPRVADHADRPGAAAPQPARRAGRGRGSRARGRGRGCARAARPTAGPGG